MAGASVAARTAHVPDRPMNEDDTHLVALPISKAAAALQLSTEGVRARIRRGQYEVRTGNDGRKLVLVPGSHLEQERGTDDERPDDRLADVLSSTLHGQGGRQATSRRRSRRPAGIFVASGSDREVAKASACQSSALTAARASLKVGARFGYQ